MAGLLALVGGAEFTPGNEAQDRIMVSAVPDGPAYVVSTAAREGRAGAVSLARRWFASLGLAIEELAVLTRGDARDPRHIERAARAGFLYLLGGDPGRVAEVLSGTEVWTAMVRAWRAGAVLAGSSAGAMGLCEWVLLRDRRPAHDIRRFAPGLGLVPGCAVLPHFDSFGRRWVASALERMPEPPPVLLGLDERTAAVWDGGGWRAEGPGTVTVIRAGAEAAVLRSGEQLSIHGPAGEQR